MLRGPGVAGPPPLHPFSQGPEIKALLCFSYPFLLLVSWSATPSLSSLPHTSTRSPSADHSAVEQPAAPCLTWRHRSRGTGPHAHLSLSPPRPQPQWPPSPPLGWPPGGLHPQQRQPPALPSPQASATWPPRPRHFPSLPARAPPGTRKFT